MTWAVVEIMATRVAEWANRQLADRAARGLNERRPRPDQWWVAAPEGRPA